MTTLDVATATIKRQPITFRMRALNSLYRRWPGRSIRLKNPGPILTFTFDDVPDSAATDGAGLVEAAGARATFFVSTSLFGTRTPDWRVAAIEDVSRLAKHGHEIGFHSHRHLPVAHMGPKAFAADFDEAEHRLASFAAPETYAYPFGFASPLHVGMLRRRVRASRTTHPGLNRGVVDPHYLRSCLLDPGLTTNAIDRMLDDACAARGWLIFTTHDVRRRPSPYGCTPKLLSHAIEGARSRGISLLTMSQALDACGLPDCPR